MQERGEPPTFVCEACGGTFETAHEPERIAREEQAFADMPDAPLAVVCEDCWRGMRVVFPTLDARYKLQGL